MQDFGQLSSKTVTEVLMLEMKMSPGAKVFLVSGYPRNMRDVVEYAEKVSVSFFPLYFFKYRYLFIFYETVTSLYHLCTVRITDKTTI